MTCEIVKVRIVKGDAKKLFQVKQPTLPTGWTLAKMNIQIGNLMKSYASPTFPMDVSLTSAESLTLNTGINEVAILLFNGTSPETAVMDKIVQVIGEPQKVKQ